jgi:hypothetical protein
VRIRGVEGGRRETVSAGQHASRAAAEQRNSAQVRLGAKWVSPYLLCFEPK